MPYNHPDLVNGSGNASSSPWVIGVKMAGIKVLPSIINAAIITSAWSAGNTYMYVATRTLRGLALNGGAPRILAKTSKYGVPYFAVLATIPIGLLGYLSAYLLPNIADDRLGQWWRGSGFQLASSYHRTERPAQLGYVYRTSIVHI